MYFNILWLTGIVRFVMLMMPFRWIAGYLGEQGFESPSEENSVKLEASRNIGRAIARVSRHTLWESKCLVQAITGKILLKRKGIASTLYLGVRRNGHSQMVAHAWLRVGSMVVTGRRGLEEFTVISCFGDKIHFKNHLPVD